MTELSLILLIVVASFGFLMFAALVLKRLASNRKRELKGGV